MMSNATKLIEQWFDQHSDDGEFATERPATFTIFPPSNDPGRIVYATKKRLALLALEQCGQSSRLGVIAPSKGLPCAEHAAWMSREVADHEVYFLGDMDPVDLMIFVWLRAQLLPKPVVYLGVSDAYLARLEVSLPESFTLHYAASEQESLSLLPKVFPDYRAAIGENCSRLLEQGRKIELEAVVSAMGSPASLLLPALGDPHA